MRIFLVGAALTGVAFGAAQNVSLVWMFDRAVPAQYDDVSAIWTIAYDGGPGLGAAAFGFVLTPLGHQSAFMRTGALLMVIAVAFPLAFRKGEFTGSNIAMNLLHAPSGASAAADRHCCSREPSIERQKKPPTTDEFQPPCRFYILGRQE